jgi:hypothetical protein
MLEQPAIETGMVDLDASFFHHFLELAVPDRVHHTLPRAPEDDLTLKMTAFEIDHRGAFCGKTPQDHRCGTEHRTAFATEPIGAPRNRRVGYLRRSSRLAQPRIVTEPTIRSVPSALTVGVTPFST